MALCRLGSYCSCTRTCQKPPGSTRKGWTSPLMSALFDGRSYSWAHQMGARCNPASNHLSLSLSLPAFSETGCSMLTRCLMGGATVGHTRWVLDAIPQVATLIAVYANWCFARIKGAGWGWAGVIWLHSIVTYVPLDFLKFAIRYIQSGKAWNNLLENKKDYGKEEREAQWAAAQRTLHGLQPPETNNLFNEKNSYRELSEIAEQAKRRAEVARLRELHTLKGHVESVVKLKGLDIDTIQQHYTV